MRKLYFGILLLFSIILVSLSFIGGIGKNKEGFIYEGYPSIRCSTYKWVQTLSGDSYNNTKQTINEWTMFDLCNNIIMKDKYPSNITPKCTNIVSRCNNYRLVSDPLSPPTASNSTTSSTTLTRWNKVDFSGTIMSRDIIAPNGTIPTCENTPTPLPPPLPQPINNLPPWKIFSVGVLNETKQNINNMIESQSDKIKSTSLK